MRSMDMDNLTLVFWWFNSTLLLVFFHHQRWVFSSTCCWRNRSLGQELSTSIRSLINYLKMNKHHSFQRSQFPAPKWSSFAVLSSDCKIAWWFLPKIQSEFDPRTNSIPFFFRRWIIFWVKGIPFPPKNCFTNSRSVWTNVVWKYISISGGNPQQTHTWPLEIDANFSQLQWLCRSEGKISCANWLRNDSISGTNAYFHFFLERELAALTSAMAWYCLKTNACIQFFRWTLAKTRYRPMYIPAKR